MIRVLVVDDSAVVRKILTEQLSRQRDIEVVGSAPDPYVARDKIADLHPDVITLDIEMPRMDGLSFLSALMKHHPIPVVIVSSLAPKNSEPALRALALGAVEVVSKPGSQYTAPKAEDPQLVRAIRAAANARLQPTATRARTSETAPPAVARVSTLRTTQGLVAVGASTGGTQALDAYMRGLPADTPGTLIVQHMPANFTQPFAVRLNEVSAMHVREARDGDVVTRGLCLIAPGDLHMTLQRSGTQYVVRLKNAPRVHFQRPSVDVLFHSVAQTAGRNAVGVLLTGMGADGADGLLAMRNSGAWTVAQDEATCIVYGMPREAVRLNAVEAVLPLCDIPQAVLEHST